MPTQKEIAEHLGISQQAVSKTLSKMKVEWKEKSLDEIRLAYIRRLREIAAGHASIDGSYDLNRERAMTERVDRELKLYQLAEKKGELINVADLYSELETVFVGMRQEMLSRDDKLKSELDTLYGVNIDISILNEYTTNALEHLSGYLSRHQCAPAEDGNAAASPAQDGDNTVG